MSGAHDGWLGSLGGRLGSSLGRLAWLGALGSGRGSVVFIRIRLEARRQSVTMVCRIYACKIIRRNADREVVLKYFLQWISKVSECQCELFVVGSLWVTEGGVRNHIYDDSLIGVHNYKYDLR